MAPNTMDKDVILKDHHHHDHKITKASPRTYQVVYRNVILFIYYHAAGIYGLYLSFTTAMWTTIFFSSILFFLSGMGIIVGAHRLFSHKSYKATKPLQIFLMLCHTMANQHSVIHWARDHRLHHKFSDTDADPHNASRGFFYSHVGWLLVRKHPEVKKQGKLIDISDLTSNPVLMFQHKNSVWFVPLIAFFLPTILPSLWGESYFIAWHINLFRYIMNLNTTFCINSFAHLYGNKPYDKSMGACQNMALYCIALGEGFHNFHHAFPCDYQSNEFGKVFNVMTGCINLFARLGLAYDLKTVSKDVARARMLRTGDGSKPAGYVE